MIGNEVLYAFIVIEQMKTLIIFCHNFFHVLFICLCHILHFTCFFLFWFYYYYSWMYSGVCLGCWNIICSSGAGDLGCCLLSSNSWKNIRIYIDRFAFEFLVLCILALLNAIKRCVERMRTVLLIRGFDF